MNKYQLDFTKKEKLDYPVGNDMTLAIKYIAKIKEIIVENKILTDISNIAIWCRGSSGTILATLLCNTLLLDLNKKSKIIHVKKNNESSHANSYSETNTNTYNIIIDDFSQSGTTINAIYSKMLDYKNHNSGIVNLLILQTINEKDSISFIPNTIITDLRGIESFSNTEIELDKINKSSTIKNLI